MRVIISAGGTGGHIFPAIAIINIIKKQEPDSTFLFIGTHNRMEKDLIPDLGIEYKSLTITGFKRKLTLSNFKSIYYYFKSRKSCKKIIKDFKPDIVIGCGGYVTAPVISIAHNLGYKTFIHEQNSVVGLTNKYLSRFATKIGVSFASSLKYFPENKTIITGNPCSDRVLEAKKADKSIYGLTKGKKLVLIVMGSLGSRTVNEKITAMLDMFKYKSYEVIYITGNSYYEIVSKKKVSNNIKIFPFINEMASLLKNVDLMVSRAGASTMSEITSLGIPTIFIPSPYVTDNHQYKNAMDLVNKNAGLILEESNLEANTLIKMIDDVINDEKLYKNIKKNLKNIGIQNSSLKIYDILKEMMCDNK